VEEVELLARGSWHRVYGMGTWNPREAIGRVIAGIENTEGG
jgi:hypothetical protein